MTDHSLASALRPALVLIGVFTVLTGVAVPLGFVAGAGVAVPARAAGSLVRRDGRIIGSALIGQQFTSAKYFHGRPSATSGPDPKDASQSISVPYNAANSGGSNLAPTSKALLERVRADVAAYDGAPRGQRVPGDAVTSSASGLDPDISPQNAARQLDRVAKARGMAPARVQALLAQHIQGRALGLIGEPHVNVLALNLALDGASAP